MDGFLDALAAFGEGLASVRWQPLGLAVLCHLAKVLALTRAWRNVLADAYPQARVKWSTTLGAYLAGSGVNSIVPARGGEVLRLYLAHHRIPGSTYTTLAASILVLTLFDALAAGAIFAWALYEGVLPALDVLPRLPAFDTGWLLDHPRLTLTLAAALLVALVLAGVWAYGHYRAFRDRVAQGFAVLGDRPRYLRRVALWQAVDWVFRLAAAYFFLRAFGLVGGVRSAFLVQVTQSLSTLVPFSPGGIGTEQALLVYVMSGTAGAAELLAFSVGMRIVLIATNVALGFAAIGLVLRTFRWRRHVAAQRA